MYGWRNFAQLNATPTASGRRAAATSRPIHRVGTSCGRRTRHHSAMSSNAPAHAQPAVVRHSTAPSVKIAAPTSALVVGRCRNPSMQKAAPREVAIAHEYASWYTNGIDARKSTTEPAEMLPTSTACPTASARVSAALPRSIRRTRHTRRASSTVDVHQATSMDGAVSLPSSSSVNASRGMRAMDGPGGKYMYSRPSTTKASMPSSPSGSSRSPPSSAWAWTS
jgi:hypothetical protein